MRFGLLFFLALVAVTQSHEQPDENEARVMENFGSMTENLDDEPFIGSPEMVYCEEEDSEESDSSDGDGEIIRRDDDINCEGGWGLSCKLIPAQMIVRVENSQIMESIQMGISTVTQRLASTPERNLLMEDFSVIETLDFPASGSQWTPAHENYDFKFKSYAPNAYRHFRKLCGLSTSDYLSSIGDASTPVRELSNPAASGSGLFLTHDDRFFIKTLSPYEAEFLKRLLPQYYMNLRQNPNTLLPKLFGQYGYVGGGRNMKVMIMTNLLPSHVKMHEKYDLKGSTLNRVASDHEKSKKSPTLRDTDFTVNHKEGFTLEPEIYYALMKTMAADLRVLQSFKIMDYSLLLGVHVLDPEEKVKPFEPMTLGSLEETGSWSGIPARDEKGRDVLLFMGIIDILQGFRLRKKLEFAMKSMVHESGSISVNEPSYYRKRFQEFVANKVLRPANGASE